MKSRARRVKCRACAPVPFLLVLHFAQLQVSERGVCGVATRVLPRHADHPPPWI